LSELPVGTVTFLFTDIEGSTRLLADVGDAAYGAILDTERALITAAAEAEGGTLFGSEGDAHFVAFASAPAAIRAAASAQRALARHPWAARPVRVRMGIHTGAAQLIGDDYVGLEVHRAARVAAAGHGGQVLVSEASKALVVDAPAELGLRELGVFRLKDLARPERLFQLEADDLETTFPPLRTLDVTPNNLPPQLTSFIGRPEVETAAGLLGRSRLLTLTGPGGTGKTRLSLTLAGDCAERFPDGAWFVPLAPVTDPDLVASAIAASIGVLAPGQRPIDGVRNHLRERTALLVLDNFEQVVAGAPVVAELLRDAPRLTVIASSRAPLRIAGEQEFPVPPLSLPAAGAASAAEVMASEAVRLFVERAVTVRPDFALNDDNAGDVAEIVRRLDGLPLAIELAAARIRILSPSAMARRLDDRLSLLTAGGRDLPERQRTLRGAIDWSHDLLEPDDRRLFARLGIFAGGGPIEVAVAVCQLPGDPAPLDVEGGLERMTEQSLVRINDDAHGDIRFEMLETIREYALTRLEATGETATLRDRHADAFLDFLAAAAADGPGRADQGRRLDRLEDEHDNLRAAFEHLVAQGDTAKAADLGYRAWRFWHMRGHLIEGRARLDTVLAMPAWTEAPSLPRLRALEAAGGLAYWAGDTPAASGFYAEAVEVARALGDEAELANALYNRFFAHRSTSGIDDWIATLAEDRSLLDEALAIWTRLGDEVGVAKAHWGIAEHSAYAGDDATAEASATLALAIFERAEDHFWIAWAHFTRGFGRALAGRYRESAADIGAALDEFHESRDVSGVVLTLTAIGTLLLMAGRAEDAYEVGGAARHAVAETGLHLASLWPTGRVPMVDPDTTDASLRDALARGASWPRPVAVSEGRRLARELADTPPG
jgi:predicted ATPase/class 3 adenylate cyclase